LRSEKVSGSFGGRATAAPSFDTAALLRSAGFGRIHSRMSLGVGGANGTAAAGGMLAGSGSAGAVFSITGMGRALAARRLRRRRPMAAQPIAPRPSPASKPARITSSD
jgi:hypothetical protein